MESAPCKVVDNFASALSHGRISFRRNLSLQSAFHGNISMNAGCVFKKIVCVSLYVYPNFETDFGTWSLLEYTPPEIEFCRITTEIGATSDPNLD